MKPNEGYEISQEDLISQLGLLIFEGRKPCDVKSNLKDSANYDDGLLLHHRKENFLSFWKLCSSSTYIEVWLYCQEQFDEKEAINGHSGYLLIEQWEVEIKSKRNSDHGLHCTEKMLIQAIKSKLYFSQLSAWFSVTDGKFPRHTYFRLCQTENKTPLKRFIRGPDFHQFPEVSICPMKELVVSLHSLPHSDLPSDYPMFSWVLTDQPSETPQRTGSEKLPPGYTLLDECSFHNKSQNRNNRETTSSHVVRKLEFENVGLGERELEGKQSVRKDVDSRTFALDSEHSVGSELSGFSSKKETSEYFCEEPQNSMSNGKEIRKNPRNSSEKSPLANSSSENDVQSYFPNGDVYSFHSGISKNKEYIEPGEEPHRISTNSKGQKFDQGICEIVKNIKENDKVPSCCRKTNWDTFESFGKTRTWQKKSTKYNRNCDIFRTDMNSECSNQEISRKSLLTRNIRDGKHTTFNKDALEYSMKEKEPSSKIYKDKKFKQGGCNDKRMKDFGLDRQRVNIQGLETGDLHHTTKNSWNVDKCGNVLHGTKKELGNISPELRHVMDKECEEKMSDRLLKCCLSNEKRFEEDQGECKKKVGKTETMRKSKQLRNKDNVFSEEQCAIIPSRNSRYHFRHASTGTLAVFHPRTGLPMSSSPAPFRRTSQKQTVDDLCSPTREQPCLSDQFDNLSRSAPTLTTQSLLVNFEESVLNNRLLPDGVVEGFTAELSASGSKKCLAHVTLPVQAYFFKLSDDDAPSPYMGYISLNVPGLPKKGYHVPKKGTVQLTLFNPNQTVVKVFVVLYDFSDMQPNFRTFLRQKTTSVVKSDGLVDRIHDNLHYLIHLRFASSKSGHIYLHTDIRVIFARHPPEESHLRTTTCGPTNPKYVPRQETTGEVLN